MTDTVILEIDWPKETEKGKWLLYLMKISSTGVEHINCSPKEEINPQNKVSENLVLLPARIFCKEQFRYVMKEVKNFTLMDIK